MKLTAVSAVVVLALSAPAAAQDLDALFLQDVSDVGAVFSNAGGQQVADQFHLQGHRVIQEVVWYGTFQDLDYDPVASPRPFLIEFYAGGGNVPDGPPIWSQILLPAIRDTGLVLTGDAQYDRYPIYEFQAALLQPLAAPPGRSWISIARSEPVAGQQFLWSRSSGPPGSSYARKSADGEWSVSRVSIITVRAGLSANMAFALLGAAD